MNYTDLNQSSPQTHEAYLDKWEVVNLTHTRMSAEESEEREEVLAEVMDPTYLMGRDVDGDAEGGESAADNKGMDLGLSLNGVPGGGSMVDVMEM